METRPKNREWVKNAAIIFLVVLLVLTFFSNTIMNRTLPEVATQYVTDGSITAEVRGTGKVTANGNHQVKATETREIRAVMIKAGQKVEEGDVLFVLGSGEKSELEQAQEQLRQLQTSYQRTALGGSTADYTADEYRVQLAEEHYNEAEKTYQALVENQSGGSDKLSELQKQLQLATVERDKYKEVYDAKVAEAGVALAAAEDERLTAEQDVMMAEHWKQSTLTEEQKDYLTHPEKRIEELEAFSPAPTATPAPSPDPTPSPDPDGGEGGEGGEIGPVVTPTPQPTDPPADLASLLEKWKTLKEKTDAVIEAKTALGAISTQQLDAAQKKMDEIQAEIDRTADSPAIREAKAARDEAYTSYLDMYNALQQRKMSDAKSNASLGLELSELSQQIEAQKKKIAELSGGEENQITANVSGTVQSVEITAGDTVAKDQVLCVIEVPDMGYTLSFSVTNDQASRLKVGDSATVSNYYWGSQIVATLESIRVDPKDPQSSKLLTFDVSGDVNAGTDLTISVGSRSANYDTIVPKSAIHNDANGDFVYKVEAKSSPLGNRYIARRVSVEILAQDDTSAAITGDIGWGDYVITTSNAPIKNGDMVRLAD